MFALLLHQLPSWASFLWKGEARSDLNTKFFTSMHCFPTDFLFAEVWPDAMMVRYCLCCVVRPVATELAQLPDTPFKPSLRRSLFDALSLGSEEGSLGIHSPIFGMLMMTSEHDDNAQCCIAPVPWKLQICHLGLHPWLNLSGAPHESAASIANSRHMHNATLNPQ